MYKENTSFFHGMSGLKTDGDRAERTCPSWVSREGMSAACDVGS